MPASTMGNGGASVSVNSKTGSAPTVSVAGISSRGAAAGAGGPVVSRSSNDKLSGKGSVSASADRGAN